MGNFTILLHHVAIMDYLEGKDYVFKHALGAWVRGLIMGIDEEHLFTEIEGLFTGPECTFEDFCDDITTIMADLDDCALKRTKEIYQRKEKEISNSSLTCYIEVNAIDRDTLCFTVTGIR